MPELNCTNCGCDISQYKNYADSPCATCKLAKEYYKLPKAVFFLSSDEDSDEECGTGIPEEETVAAEQPVQGYDDARIESNSIRSLKVLREAIEQQVMATFSGMLMRMLKLSREDPVMFEIVIKKMQFPHMSYSEIGDTMTPKVTKQIVLYNLKKAIERFPELISVIHTDTRFTSGKMALETVAARARRNVAISKLKGALYGDDPSLKSMTIKEINSIINAPCVLDDAIYDFNWYADDADELRRERLKSRNKEKLGI